MKKNRSNLNLSNSRKYIFHVNGMHCNSCVLLIESELKNYSGVIKAEANLTKRTLEVIGDFLGKTDQEIADMLTVPIKSSGYTLSIDRIDNDQKRLSGNNKFSDFKIAIPVAFGFLALFIFLQKIGLVNLVSGGSSVSFGTAFIIGIIASLSTCMAVVGGLLLSMSATFARDGDKIRPQLMFHFGRLISFFVLGGVIGVLGSAFTLNITATFILGVVIGLVMLILGINLLDIFHWSKRFQIRMPKFISSYAHGVSRMNHSFTPFLVGIATFFLPCGFTQSMQLYTLSTNGFWQGAMTMFIFALGTLPVLLLISFSSFSIKNSAKSGVFFKSAGLIVILFAIFNILNSLAIIGVIKPIFNF